MNTAVLIAQISDLHIKRPGETAYGIVDTARALKHCIATLNGLRPRPALVVASGDLVDGGDAAEYAHLSELLAALELPLAVLPGNHDARGPMRRAFAQQRFASPDGALNTCLTIGPLALLLVDSSVPEEPHGHLDGATLAWLDATLAADAGRPALIFLHHPPFRAGIWHMDRQNLVNADDLAGIVRRHPRVRLVAAGHVHRAVLTLFAGVPATICPAPNHAVDLDLDHARAPSFRLEPPAFHLHAWFAGDAYGSVVTHSVPIGDFAGPHPFFDVEGKLL